MRRGPSDRARCHHGGRRPPQRHLPVRTQPAPKASSLRLPGRAVLPRSASQRARSDLDARPRRDRPRAATTARTRHQAAGPPRCERPRQDPPGRDDDPVPLRSTGPQAADPAVPCRVQGPRHDHVLAARHEHAGHGVPAARVVLLLVSQHRRPRSRPRDRRSLQDRHGHLRRARGRGDPRGGGGRGRSARAGGQGEGEGEGRGARGDQEA